MSNSKKPLAVLSMAAVAGLLAVAVTTPVSAAASAIAVNGTDAKTYEYNYAALKASAVSSVTGDTTGAKLYQDFLSRKSTIKGYYDDVQKAYVDYSVVSAAATDAVLKGQTFDFAGFLKTATTETLTPDKVTLDASGNVTVTPATPVDVALTVSAVSASNSSTLQVTGTGLDKLTASAITVDGAAIKSVTASTDGTSATLVLDGTLAPNSTTNVTITDSTGAKAFTVTNGFVVNSVAVTTASYGYDRTNQKVAFTVNGSSNDATVDYLNAAGYDVTFVATKHSDGTSQNILDNGSGTGINNNTTGAILAGNAVGDYDIQMQVSKNGTICATNTATIHIVNLDAVASAIDTVKFGVVGTGTVTYDDNSSATNELTGNAFTLNSNTLVAGEAAKIYSVKTLISGTSTLVSSAASVSAKSSNSAVVSVSTDANNLPVLTANTAGTATITVTANGVSKDYTFTVTNKKRALTTVKFDKTTANIVGTNSVDVTVTTLDQFGDPYGVTTADSTSVNGTSVYGIKLVVPTASSNALITAPTFATDTNSATLTYGKGTLTLTGAQVGTGSLLFKNETQDPNNSNAVSGTTIGTVYLNVTGNNAVSTKKLEIVNETNQASTNSLELSDTKNNKVSYRLGQYNSSGVYISPAALLYSDYSAATAAAGKYFVYSANPSVATATADTATDNSTNGILITAVAAGTTDIVVKDNTGAVVTKTTITVTNTPYKITGVSFKSIPQITYTGKALKAEDILTTTTSVNDDIVSGVTLNKSTTSKVRIVEAADPANATKLNHLFIDADNDGLFTTNDTDLGIVTITVASDANATLAAVTPVLTDLANTAFYTSAQGEKGTLIVKVQTNASDATTAVAGSSISIDTTNAAN